jgi:hypothetical protein
MGALMTTGRKEPTPPPSNARGRELLVSEAQLATVFTEWDRRYREEPDRFVSEAVHLLKETPETYGEACAPYFIQIFRDLNPADEPRAVA